MSDALGIYVSVPFCKAKCSFCNFASGVFGAGRMEAYGSRLREEMQGAAAYAARLGMEMPRRVDSIYLGGGTPSLLEMPEIEAIFGGIANTFTVEAGAEVTVECAPGQLSDASLQAFIAAGVNRLSFGVQSFVDRESAAVGRLHTGAACRDELRRVEAAGVQRVGIDLIAGLPHQTEASWRYSVEEAIASGVEHVSVYMLEVDDGSRLGRESLAGGRRFGAGELPADDRVADWYEMAGEWLESAGLRQYEISNFGVQSRHNRKYWERKPYLGFGLDAHSMLRDGVGGVRWANAEEMESYVGLMGARGFARTVDRVDRQAAFEEELFLGLRLVEGVDLVRLRARFGELVDGIYEALDEILEAGLMEHDGDRLKLTGAGRIASNEVFGRLMVQECLQSCQL